MQGDKRHDDIVLVTVTGPDGPGITTSLSDIVAHTAARLIDIEQVVMHGRLTLVFSLSIPEDSQSDVLKDLLFKAKDLGVQLDFDILPVEPKSEKIPERFAITVTGPELEAGHIREITSILSKEGVNIAQIKRISPDRFNALEIEAQVPAQASSESIRSNLTRLSKERGLDIALQRDGLMRRAKRLIVFDMDSTLIQAEVINELARAAGTFDQVQAITAAAMAGDLNFEVSLQKRVSLLKGLPEEYLAQISNALPLSPGAETLCQALKTLGYKTALLSGGFNFAARHVQARLGLSYAYANQLEVVDGKLTGHLVGDIMTPERKATLLDVIATHEGISLEQTVAVGDGANDALMLEKAGLGIAFHAKPYLKKRADTSISEGGLERILYFLGYSSHDLAELMNT